jgi:ureidoglycolate lyase/seryl-tRNA synthetase
VPLALAGDDVTPDDFICFRFDGRHGLYIHPGVWHEGVFGYAGTQRFFDSKAPSMRACRSIFRASFGCLLEAPLG